MKQEAYTLCEHCRSSVRVEDTTCKVCLKPLGTPLQKDKTHEQDVLDELIKEFIEALKKIKEEPNDMWFEYLKNDVEVTETYYKTIEAQKLQADYANLLKTNVNKVITNLQYRAIEHDVNKLRYKTIEEMSLMDIVELISDWKVMFDIYDEGDFEKVLNDKINKYDIDEQLGKVIKNTFREVGEK